MPRQSPQFLYSSSVSASTRWFELLFRSVLDRPPSKLAWPRPTVSIIYLETSAVETHRGNAARERPQPERAMTCMHWESSDLAKCYDLPILFT